RGGSGGGREGGGGTAAVGAKTGGLVWLGRPPALATPCTTAEDRRCVQAQSAAVTVIPGAVFSGATNGIMRAYSTEDGRALWEHDTAQPYTTVNGLPARAAPANPPRTTAAPPPLLPPSSHPL